MVVQNIHILAKKISASNAIIKWIESEEESKKEKGNTKGIPK